MDLIFEYRAQLIAVTAMTVQLSLVSLVFAVKFGLLGDWSKLS
jgi:ABC-type arginine transport system permease subunit